jgi:hypothetical protein
VDWFVWAMNGHLSFPGFFPVQMQPVSSIYTTYKLNLFAVVLFQTALEIFFAQLSQASAHKTKAHTGL